MIELIVIKGLAVYMSVNAFMMIRQSLYLHDIASHKSDKIITIDELKWYNRLMQNKPFNCGHCMSFWFACILFIIPVEFCIILAIAGLASLLYSILIRLETLVS